MMKVSLRNSLSKSPLISLFDILRFIFEKTS